MADRQSYKRTYVIDVEYFLPISKSIGESDPDYGILVSIDGAPLSPCQYEDAAHLGKLCLATANLLASNCPEFIESVTAWFENSPKDSRTDQTYLMIDRNTGYYKIGRSIDPITRERTLQSEKPTIELIASCPRSVVSESELHREFAEYRIRGEWFDLSSGQVNSLVDLMSGNNQ